MGNKFKLGKGHSAPGIQKRIAKRYKDYAGSLPAEFGLNQDKLTAKITCEGSIEVSLGLMAEAQQNGNKELETAIRESLIGARDRLNGLELEAPTNVPG